MSSNSKTSVSKAQSEQHKKILGQLLKLEANRRCCDCSARGPTWASVNLGLFVCLNCSGIHRSLGTHLSKVRSTTLDTWLPEQVEFVSKLGNVRANAYWEARLPRGFRRPAEGDMSALKDFITEKYQNQVQRFCKSFLPGHFTEHKVTHKLSRDKMPALFCQSRHLAHDKNVLCYRHTPALTMMVRQILITIATTPS